MTLLTNWFARNNVDKAEMYLQTFIYCSLSGLFNYWLENYNTLMIDVGINIPGCHSGRPRCYSHPGLAVLTLSDRCPSPERDSNLGPKHLSLLELEALWLRPLGHHGRSNIFNLGHQILSNALVKSKIIF